MKKLVIYTQYKENYGAHDWDGKGECPQYWKFKGGDTYVLPNCGDSADVDAVLEVVKPFITHSDDYSEEYILSTEVVDYNAKVAEDWETITEFNLIGGTVNFMKVTDNREDGWMLKEILEKIETWTGCLESNSGRANYRVEFLMEDGDSCNSENELRDWFETKEAA